MPNAQQIGSVDVACTYSGDVILDATGAPLLVIDTLAIAAATEQRVYRLINTAARLVAADGTPLASADDPFHQDWGAGLPRHVDALWTIDLQDDIESAILEGLSADPGVATSPVPTVGFRHVDPFVYIAVNFSAISGTPSRVAVVLQVQSP